MKFSSALVVAFATATSALTAAEWRSQSIYQLLTDRFARTDNSLVATCDNNDGLYCGGSWQGVINKLDYIQNMGFTAIWISPVVAQMSGSSMDGASYHGYWAQDFWSLNPSFGTAADLKALSTALHARGMYLMIDVVFNHMAYLGCGTCVDYTILKPFNSASYFHSFCNPINYSDPVSTLQCWEGDNTVALPDLRTEDTDVQTEFIAWTQQMVANYSIDGFRVDSAQQTGSVFFDAVQGNVSDLYMVGEVLNGDPTYVCGYQGHINALLNYPVQFQIITAFSTVGGSMSALVNVVNNMKSICPDTTLLGSFLENHDIERFPSYTSDMSLTKNAIAFAMLQDGIPMVFQGQEQGYTGTTIPTQRTALWFSNYTTTSPLYSYIGKINAIRNQAIYKSTSYTTYKSLPSYSDTNTTVMRKGVAGYQTVSVFSNKGASGSSYTLTLSSTVTGFTASQAVTELVGCTSYTTDSSGNLNVAMSSGLPRIFYPTAQITGSSLCSTTTTATSTSVAATSTSTSCSTPIATVAVTFSVLVSTVVGQTIKLVGSTTTLGSWAPASALALSASAYTVANPIWSITINLAAGTSMEYKFINVASDGTVTWESDPNLSYTVPSGCAAAVSVSSSWR